MNYIKNDRGEMVIAVGAPGSLARLRDQYPKLRERINVLWMDQAGVDTARDECMGKGTFDSGYRLTFGEAQVLINDSYYAPKGTDE